MGCLFGAGEVALVWEDWHICLVLDKLVLPYLVVSKRLVGLSLVGLEYRQFMNL